MYKHMTDGGRRTHYELVRFEQGLSTLLSDMLV